jgi:hypothetical protein
MAANPELALWRAVLVLALRDDGAERWIRTQDAATVCALAGLDHDGVIHAYRGKPPRYGGKAA